MVTDLARRDLCSLGVARKRGNHKWVLLGLVPIIDPPPFGSAGAMKIARILGTSVRIFTGDAVAIAREMARTLGVGTNPLNADSIGDDQLPSDPEISTLVEETHVGDPPPQGEICLYTPRPRPPSCCNR
jgi:H+-transporting ATPase